MLEILLFLLLADGRTEVPWEPAPSHQIVVQDTVKQKDEFRPLQSLALSAISAYQKTISPLQGDVCNFTPSCSHYGYEAIKRHGFLYGMLMAGDRLQRCNFNCWRYSPRYYEVRWVKGRGLTLYDPPERNWFRRTGEKRATHVPNPEFLPGVVP